MKKKRPRLIVKNVGDSWQNVLWKVPAPSAVGPPEATSVMPVVLCWNRMNWLNLIAPYVERPSSSETADICILH